MKSKKSLFVNIVLFLTATLVGLLFAEILFRYKDGQPLRGELPFLQGKVDPHAKEKIDWIAMEIAKERNTNPAITGLYDHDPVQRTYGRIRNETLDIYENFDRKDDESLRNYIGCRVWNKNFIADLYCANEPNGFYSLNMIERHRVMYVFEPYDSAIFPIYRFLPNSINQELGHQLRFNAFGWSGDTVSFIKPENTIRLAFLGASTTQQVLGCEFAYPDYIGHWLNVWAAQNMPGVRFEFINTGRAGLKSPDFAAIMKYELAPVEPDFAIYYEGRNQIVPEEIGCICNENKLYDWLRKYALFRRLAALPGINILKKVENRKPDYSLRIPNRVSIDNPDIGSPRLPFNLPDILTDLDTIKAVSEKINCDLIVCSYAMLAHDNILDEGMKHASIYSYWMNQLGALRLSEISLLSSFQNRVFKKYCEHRSAHFIDVSSSLTRQPEAFNDGIHLNCQGMKYHAWIVFLELLPIIDKKINQGALPQPKKLHYLSHPFIEDSFERVSLPIPCD